MGLQQHPCQPRDAHCLLTHLSPPLRGVSVGGGVQAHCYHHSFGLRGYCCLGWMTRQDDKINDQQIITEMTDALGNVTQVKVKKTLSKRDLKAKLKVLKKKIDEGDELDSDEEELAIEHKLL